MKFGDLLLSEHKDHFYVMHLSYGVNKRERKRLWNYAKDNDLIGLDLPNIVKRNWTTLSELERKVARRTWIRQFDLFCKEMRTGDYAVALNGCDSLLGIACVTQPNHRFDKRLTGKEKTGFFDHIREVDWRLKYEYDEKLALPQPIKGFNNTLSRVTPRSSRWAILTSISIPKQ